jgi:hypothetical protein
MREAVAVFALQINTRTRRSLDFDTDNLAVLVEVPDSRSLGGVRVLIAFQIDQIALFEFILCHSNLARTMRIQMTSTDSDTTKATVETTKAMNAQDRSFIARRPLRP